MTPGILFQDRRFLVVDKPAGLPVHLGRAGGASVEDFFPKWRAGRNGPWLAHRLDRDTAGCLAIALKKAALVEAQGYFARGEVTKTYWAVVCGAPKAERGVVELPLGKVTMGNRWKMAVDRSAAPAVTAWQVRGRGDGVAWVEFTPRTGRTHQIRAHAALLGHPIFGDEVYGGTAGRLMLLARRIEIPLAPPVMATAPVPCHMLGLMKACGYGED
jgi:RluA family pseudouridine synthase